MAINRITFTPTKFEKSQIKFHIALIPIVIIFGSPILFIIMHAFKPYNELFAFPPKFFVSNPTLNNFRELFLQTTESGIPMSKYIFNSVLVATIVIILSLLLSSLTAFGLSKMEFKGKKLLNSVNMFALMFVPVAVAIPRFLVVSNIGIYDTMLAHIVPLIAMPIGLFLVKQFMDQVPDELIEAAQMDGATNWIIYWKICLPLVKPALITVAVLAFQTSWGNVESSQIYIDNEAIRTFPFFLNTVVANAASGNTVASAGMGAAATLISFLPNLIIFLLLQSKVMESMSRTGIK